MSTFSLKRGLDLPISGAPRQEIEQGPNIASVALIGLDYVDLKPTMAVREGDIVRPGDVLFRDKRDEAVNYLAPGGGLVKAINRGPRRVLQSIIIQLDNDEVIEPQLREPASIEAIATLEEAAVRQALWQSGHWTAFRTRPYSKVPHSEQTPAAIFVTAMDSNPLAPDPAVIIGEARKEFLAGLVALSRIGSVPIHVCHATPHDLGGQLDVPSSIRNIAFHGFTGPHPSGLAGTHMNYILPASAERTNWSIGYQDVIAIGRLFHNGILSFERVIALAGPNVKDPHLIRTRLGANTEDIVMSQLQGDEELRVISGSVLSGRRAAGWSSYLGRFHNQLCILPEGRERELLGWVNPRLERFSLLNVFFSSVGKPRERYKFDTSTNGSPRAIVPIANYEKVVPLDILPTQLLRSLVVFDTDTAQKLGALELDEEDLALCTFVDGGKHDFGPVLRSNLELIEKDG